MEAIDQSISDELNFEGNLTTRNDNSMSKSDTRRTVEDLLEIRRYKKMLDDYYDIE